MAHKTDVNIWFYVPFFIAKRIFSEYRVKFREEIIMKKLRFIAVFLAMIAIVCSFAGCSDKQKYNVKMYNASRKEINEDFIEAEDLSKDRTYIIRNDEAYDVIFANDSYMVDFNKETLVLFAFWDTFPMHSYVLDKVTVNGEKMNVDYRLKLSLWEQLFDRSAYASSPYIRFMVLKMKKTDITEVKFKEVSAYFWQR